MTTVSYIQDMAGMCALGNTAADIQQHLLGSSWQTSPLTRSHPFQHISHSPVGLIQADLPAISDPLFYSRNNRVLQATLNALSPSIEGAIQRYGAHRIGVIIGTSTSGVDEGAQALRYRHANGGFPKGFQYQQQEFSNTAQYVAQRLGTQGPCWTISTACTSGSKALASADRLLQLGVCDAVIAGGCDTLCELTLAGFGSLDAMSDDLCNPFSENRRGINIGEACALFLVSKEPANVSIAGAGETSDAHHISAPHPEGTGAEAAMRSALQQAKLTPEDIGYVNLHGTATELNDKMESLAVSRVFPKGVACSSTKSLTGHTLGAAGAIEALFCALTLQQKNTAVLPPHCFDGKTDPACAELPGLGQTTIHSPLRYAMSNSFAFGGNNIALILASHSAP